MEFHISRKARDFYGFDELFFTVSGNVIFPNFRAVRLFVQRMNEKRDLVSFPEQTIKPGQMNAMGLIDEILHYIIGLYADNKNPRAMKQALDWLYEKFGRSRLDETLQKFLVEFPAVAVYRGEIPPEIYLEGETEGVDNRQIVLEEMLMLWIANRNPSFSPFTELFDDSTLQKETLYLRIIEELPVFFNSQPPFGPDHQNLIDMLRSPAIAVPHSLSGQLEYIRERWGFLLGRH
ncbi:MAG: alpha-amylase, partial [Deltaproteobacteria bacterium]|nr:alpha-amylase [Deltaproteobacteria bacterium]